jgi:hypothetical protein
VAGRRGGAAGHRAAERLELHQSLCSNASLPWTACRVTTGHHPADQAHSGIGAAKAAGRIRGSQDGWFIRLGGAAEGAVALAVR